MKIQIKLIVITILFLLSALSAFSQTVRITLNPEPATILDCIWRTDKVGGRYEILVPDKYKSTTKSSRKVYSGTTETIDNESFEIISFDFSVGNEVASCKSTQDGFEIEFSGKNTGDNTSSKQPPPQPPTQPAQPTNQPANPLTPPDEGLAEAKKKEEVKKESADLSVPDSPGFTILGLTPQTVIRPGTPREFATSLINSLDENGNFQTGVAIDTAPFLLLVGNNVTLGEYRGIKKDGTQNINSPSAYLTRFLSRAQFSLATTKGTTNDDKSAKIGTGLHLTLFNYGDSRLDTKFDECFNRITSQIRTQAEREVPDYYLSKSGRDRYKAVLIRLIESNQNDYKKCVDQSKERNFASSSFVIGGAASWISKSGESSKFTDNGTGFWATLAYGFEGIAGLDCAKRQEKADYDSSQRCIKPQLIFHFRRRVRETVPNPLIEGLFTTKDSNLFGTRLRVGVPKWSVNFEGVYRGSRYAGRTSSNSIETSFGADYKLADNLYLNFSIGGATKESNIPNTGKVFVRTSFNWGTSQKPLN